MTDLELMRLAEEARAFSYVPYSHFAVGAALLTKSGKVKRAKAFRSHILNKKDTKRKRRLRKGGYASIPNAKVIKKLIPYK